MMLDWQTILDLYLQGEGSRAEVESLRLRLHLSRGDRDDIESSLRLVDELENAKFLAQPPAGAVERMRERLREYVVQHPAPEFAMSSPALRLGVQDAGVVEDAANSIIEGTAPAIPESNSNEELRQFQGIAGVIADSSVPPVAPSPAQERMLTRLREFQNSEAGALDPAVDRRISRQIQSATTQSERRPDLKAATIDEDEMSPREPKPDS